MTRRLVECVPNYSEGRRREVMEAIVSPFKNRPGVGLLDYRADADHNRLVVTLVGEPEPLTEALLESAKTAVGTIDLRAHSGAHPRMGAVDVIPFVPLLGLTMEDCVGIARDFGLRYFQETGVPVYFYEEAALRPNRRRLEAVRKGQFEGLLKKIGHPDRAPDIGASALHPSAGATAVGARRFLVAFNINLGTEDLDIAKSIAGAVRASGGGLAYVKAVGVALKERGMVQVSINVTDHEKNPLYRVLELVRVEARRRGVEVVETELYGLAPAAALLDSAAYYLQLAGFTDAQVIELRLHDMAWNQGE